MIFSPQGKKTEQAVSGNRNLSQAGSSIGVGNGMKDSMAQTQPVPGRRRPPGAIPPSVSGLTPYLGILQLPSAAGAGGCPPLTAAPSTAELLAPMAALQ